MAKYIFLLVHYLDFYCQIYGVFGALCGFLLPNVRFLLVHYVDIYGQKYGFLLVHYVDFYCQIYGFLL